MPHQSELDGGFVHTLQVPGRSGFQALSKQSVRRQRRARTLSLPPPRTVEQPQACSISRSFMTALLQRPSHDILQVPGRSGRQALSQQSASKSERRARTLSLPPPRTVEQPQACSIRRSFIAASLQRQPHCRQVHSLGRKYSFTKCQQTETSTHLESASVSHRRAAASLPHQSNLHGGIVAKATTLQVPGWLEPQALSQQSAHRQRRARTLSLPPPRTVEQPQACSIS